MSDAVTVKLECAKCGSSNIITPDNAAESDWISCDRCGERLATVRQLNDEIARQVHAQMAAGLKNSLKRVKGFKPR